MQEVCTTHGGHADPVGRHAQRSTRVGHRAIRGAQAQSSAEDFGALAVRRWPSFGSPMSAYGIDKFSRPTERSIDRDLATTGRETNQVVVCAARMKLGTELPRGAIEEAGVGFLTPGREINA